MKRMLLASIIGGCVGSIQAQVCSPADQDCDGIPDAIERELIDRFSPYFKFSRDNGDNETFRPADVVFYLRTSDIDGTSDEGDRVLIARKMMAARPEAVLNLSVQTDPARYCSGTPGPSTCSSDITRNARRTEYHINPDNDSGRRGANWSAVMASKNTGLFAHVVPIHLANPDAYDRTHVPSEQDAQLPLYYKIEYWQFFGYSSNNKPFDEGDHEADWDTVQLIYEPPRPPALKGGRIVSVLHYAHGKEMRFTLSDPGVTSVAVGGGILEYRGRNFLQPVPDLHDEGAESKAVEHLVRFYKDPLTGQFDHVVVYIEHGGHEFWPSAAWKFYAAQKHGGDDVEHTYLAGHIPNLGEVEHPLNEDPGALMVLRFNGYWGTYSRELKGIFRNEPPPGPPLHYEWTWPTTSSIRWKLTGITY